MIRTFCNFSQWVFYNKQFAQMSILSNLTKSPFCPGIPGVPGVPAWPWNYNNRKLLYYIAISLRHFKINLPLPRRYFDLVEFFLVSFLCTERWFPRSTLLAVGSFVCVFVLFHMRNHKTHTFCNYLHGVNSNFQNNRHYGCEVVEALCLLLFFFFLLIDETAPQLLKINEYVGKII